ncbi:DNA-directed RNA polymerase III subunit RPC4 [Sergentomyia squamirostris]
MASGESKSGGLKLKPDSALLAIPRDAALKNPVKTERLSSFKLPRDLTLGGPGPGRTPRGGASKKVYTPNLNAVRQKNTDVKTSRDTQNRKPMRSDRPKAERGGRSSKSNYIQTMGVFSEGAGKTLVKRSYEPRYSSSDRESASSRRSSLRRDAKDGDKEKKDYKALLDDSSDEDCSMDDDAMMPVMLCAAQTDKKVCKVEKVETDVVKIKVEPEDETNSNAATVSTTIPFASKIKSDPDSGKYAQSLDEILNSEKPQVFLLQLPDTLPGRVDGIPTEEEAKEKGDQEKTDSKPQHYTLLQQDEGVIGKFVRYKSGKTKLVLGNSQFDIDIGIDSEFLQQLVSIDANTERRSGNIYNLGKVQTKIIATPDWEHMFKSMI